MIIDIHAHDLPQGLSIPGGNAQGVFRIRPDCWCRG